MKVGEEYQPQFDKVIHEQTRLAILAYLSSHEAPSVGFTELRERLSLTSGNLSVHLRSLEEVGYVEIAKSFVANKPNTSVRLTSRGAQGLRAYLEKMESLIKSLKKEG